MNKDLTLTMHVASILNLSEDAAIKWIEDDKVIRKFIKSDSIKSPTEVIEKAVAEGVVTYRASDKYNHTAIAHDNDNDTIKSEISTGLDKDDRSARKRSIFMMDGKAVRLETVFIKWFERTGNHKKKETIERYLKGETLSRKDLKGYLKSASSSVEDLDTFVLLFNLLLPDRKLALNGGSK